MLTSTAELRGICTLEDIIEELVGEIYDESDEEDTSFVKLGENRYQVSAELSVSDFLDRLDLPEDTIETERTSMGGWIMDIIDRVPEQNEFISYGIFNMTVIMEDEQKNRQYKDNAFVIQPKKKGELICLSR